MLASNRVECCPEPFQMQAATSMSYVSCTFFLLLFILRITQLNKKNALK